MTQNHGLLTEETKNTKMLLWVSGGDKPEGHPRKKIKLLTLSAIFHRSRNLPLQQKEALWASASLLAAATVHLQ
jgi:hypothetical protein